MSFQNLRLAASAFSVSALMALITFSIMPLLLREARASSTFGLALSPLALMEYTPLPSLLSVPRVREIPSAIESGTPAAGSDELAEYLALVARKTCRSPEE
jgi:hypothetical protein